MWVNTHLFSVVKDDSIPSYDSAEYEQFWKEQRKLCKEGLSVGGKRITGYHYWYLNWWKLYGLDLQIMRKRIIRPRFIDLDYEKFNYIEQAWKQKKNLLFLKARQKGFSNAFAAIIGYDFTFHSASQSVIVAGQAMYAENTMRNVLCGLNALEDTEFCQKRFPDRGTYIRAAYRETYNDTTGKRKKRMAGSMAEVYMYSALNNPQILSRLSPSTVIMEEGGKWKKGYLIETYNFILPSIETEGVKTGLIIIVATGGYMDESVADIEKMFYEPDKYNLLAIDNLWGDETSITKTAIFIPAWKYKIIDRDGNSLKKESLKVIEEKRKKYSGEDLYISLTQEPLTPQEAFMVSSTGYFGEHLINELNHRKAYINTHKQEQKVKQVYLEWKNPKNPFEGVISEINDGQGPFLIIDEPIKDKNGNTVPDTYVAGIDSYDQDEAAFTNSVGSCVIFLGFYDSSHPMNKFVARLTERPTATQGGAKKFYEDCAKLCVYYNTIGRSLIEYSKILIIDWFRENGLEGLLKPRPDFVISSWIETKTLNRYGIDPMTKPFWLKILKDYLSSPGTIDKLDDVEQIVAFAKYRYVPGRKTVGAYNCDVTISSALALVCLEDEKEILLSETKIHPLRRRVLPHYVMKGEYIKLVCK